MQTLPSLQVSLPPNVQAPSLQTSPMVQTLPSVQAIVLLVLAQPVLGSQLSVVQTFASSHGVTAPGRQAPALQASPTVQALSSVHLPASSAVWVQPMAMSQASAVQGFLSLQSGALPATQAPSLQASPVVQAEPSSQVAVLGRNTQPLAASHESEVQPF